VLHIFGTLKCGVTVTHNCCVDIRMEQDSPRYSPNDNNKGKEGSPSSPNDNNKEGEEVHSKLS
jgi:hypothetical protein